MLTRGEARQLERVRQLLAAVGEGGTDHGLELAILRRQLPAPAKSNERRVDVRSRPKDVPRHRVEARSLSGQLNEHRDCSVRLRLGLGKEAVGDLTLHHHAPDADSRQSVEAFGDERRRDVVGKVGDELRRRRHKRAQVERERVTEVQRDVLPPGEHLAQRWLE